MSDVCEHRVKHSEARRQRSIYRVHYSLERLEPEEMARPLAMPTALQLNTYDRQVAGHSGVDNKKYLGLLQCNNGTILKPILKASLQREVEFYERLASTECPDLVELRRYTPKFYGCRKFTYNGHQLDYIILEDLTERMTEPCIMDVKIGRRTWDPLASEEKIRNEEAKYAQCKQEYGFCIPGYQVYRLSSGKLLKYGKDYGKKMHGKMVRDAIRSFLNGVGSEGSAGSEVCRALVLQLVSELWKLQRWSARPSRVRLYSASLLLAYDAARLRACCGPTDGLDRLHRPLKCRPPETARRRSIHSMHSLGSSFSGQLSAAGPVYRKLNSVPIAPLALAQASFSPPPKIESPWTEALDRLNHNHSFEHNYEDKLYKIKMNYRAILDQLSSDAPSPNPWGTVKIIDFAHAFFDEDDETSIDQNFKEGVDNFVAIFESFLKETDDQVF